jgi:hypothetical protein
MRNILKFGIISFAFSFGLVLATADTANAQNRREARREYRDDVRGSRRDYRDDIRESRRNRSSRGLRRGWTIGRGNAWGRRDNRNSTRYYYRNGRLYRRY